MLCQNKKLYSNQISTPSDRNSMPIGHKHLYHHHHHYLLNILFLSRKPLQQKKSSKKQIILLPFTSTRNSYVQRDRKRTVMENAAVAGRKRKVYSGESELSTSLIQLKTRSLAVVKPDNSASPASSGDSSSETDCLYNALASCCSSNRSSELTKRTSKFIDLEDNEITVEYISTSAGDLFDCGERRETSPLREDQAESGELESTARPRDPNPHSRSTAEKMPSESELEEFFVAAEKNLQKKFLDKYNYDIVKDQPLEGRYQWVQVQIKP